VAVRPLVPRLADIIEAIERVRGLLENVSIEAFEADWQKQWLAQRGVEIISEASRHPADDLKARYPEIPWKKIAGVGNVLRHDYERIAAPVIWTLVRQNLPQLDQVCREELAAAAARARH
jgi:uncharacterized protein with HEPN domain